MTLSMNRKIPILSNCNWRITPIFDKTGISDSPYGLPTSSYIWIDFIISRKDLKWHRVIFASRLR